MARYSHLRRLPPLVGVVTAAVMALSATPAAATIVCTQGHTPPSPYCHNVKPTAVTGVANKIKGTSANLNGAAGSTVGGGDPTKFFFQYGTSTAYGKQTATKTLGTCQPGHNTYPYCNTPASTGVGRSVSGLTPCTKYHFQLVATNHDGTTKGGDKTFKTGFAKPLTDVKSPSKVKHGHKFKVKFKLLYNAKVVKIFMKKKNGVAILKTYKYGSLRAGKYQKTIKAPKKKGDYIVEVFAKLGCGQQNIKNKLKVT